MALDITGKILQIMPPTSGTSKAGKDWVKQEFVIETQETYPKKVCISLMGEKTQELSKYTPGSEVKVSLNLESREYNGEWYTNVNAWRIESAGGAPSVENNQSSQTTEEPPYYAASTDSSTDDLPF